MHSNLDEILQEMTSNLYNYLEEDTESSMSCTAQYMGLSFDDSSRAFADFDNVPGQQNATVSEMP